MIHDHDDHVLTSALSVRYEECDNDNEDSDDDNEDSESFCARSA